MPRVFTLLLAVLAATLALYGQGKNEGLQAQQKLSAAMPAVRWIAKSVVVGDIACDRRADRAYLGRASGKIYVGLVRASTGQPEILEFGIDPSRQDGICALPAKLALESLDYDLNEVKGFERSRICKGLVLTGGDCDPVHLFWNHVTKRLKWWRN